MSNKKSRRTLFSLDGLCMNYVHYTNPLVPAAWSFFLPGFGHLLMGQYVQGWLLLLWEVVVNVKSHFNEAIMYSLTGRFEEATRILSQEGQWLVILYTTVFVYSLWGSYNLAVETNHLTYLSHAENAPYPVFTINGFQYNFLTKLNPWMATLWSILMPGLGDLYNRRIISSTSYLLWWIIICYKSHVLQSIHYTSIGDFKNVISILDPDWFLFLPSMYVFAAYNAYVHSVETNKIFDKEQANFLRLNYQEDDNFPLYTKEDTQKMRIVATFDHSPYVEMALVGLGQIGISKKHIYATTLDKRNKGIAFVDTIHRSDGRGFFDATALLAGFFTALGGIYGFVLKGGPVLWGLIGFVIGSILGITFELINLKLKQKSKTPKTEVVVIVECKIEQVNEVQKILWNNNAFGISTSSTQELD